MQCAAATLSELAANPRWLGATIAFTLVLHISTQDLRRYVLLYVLMACGGLDPDRQWCKPKRNTDLLFEVNVLCKFFRAKYLEALRSTILSGELASELVNTDLA